MKKRYYFIFSIILIIILYQVLMSKEVNYSKGRELSLPKASVEADQLLKPMTLISPDSKSIKDSPIEKEIKNIVLLVTKDDICKLYKNLSRAIPPDAYLAAAKLLPQFKKLKPSAQALIFYGLGRINEAFALIKNDISQDARMFKALMLGGFLHINNEKTGFKTDLEVSRKIFENLSADDPENASYHYFLIYIYHQLNYADLEIDEEIMKLPRRKNFDLKLQSVWENLWQNLSFNSSGILLAKIITRNITMPNLVGPMKIIYKRIKKNRELNSPILIFSQMVRKQEISKNNELEFLDYFSSNYKLSGNLGRIAWSNLHSTAPLPKALEKRIDSFGKGTQDVLLEKFMNSLDVNRRKKECDRIAADFAFDELKLLRGW